MYLNIKEIEEILEKMRCDFGNKFWKDFMRKEYSLIQNSCSEEALEQLEVFIPIIQSKLLILKNFQKGTSYYNYPSRLCKTDIDYFWNCDKILSACDNKILEQFKQYGIEKNLLSISNIPCNDCK